MPSEGASDWLPLGVRPSETGPYWVQWVANGEPVARPGLCEVVKKSGWPLRAESKYWKYFLTGGSDSWIFDNARFCPAVPPPLTLEPLPTEPGEYIVTRKGKGGEFGAALDEHGQWWHAGRIILDVTSAKRDST